MTRYLFSSLLLLLLVSCALCGVVSAKSVDLFGKEDTQALKPDGTSQRQYDIAEVASPSMAGGDDILLGHVLAKLTGSNKYIIFTRSIETVTNWPTAADEKINWKAEAATPDTSNTQTIAFGTVKKGENLYTLYANRKSASGSTQPWDFKLATGAITGAAGLKKIAWTEQVVDVSKVTDKDKLKAVTPKDGTAFLVGDKPVYVLRGKKDTGDDKVFVVARMDGAGASSDWTFLIQEAAKDCDAAFFSLGGKIYMAPKGATCADKTLKVLDDSWNKWEAATGDVAKNLKSLEGKIDFVLPVNIDGKGDVLLITEKKQNKGTPLNSDYFLYVARGNNIAELPQSIVTNVAKTSDASLFYAKDQLFFLSQRDAKVDLDRLEGVPEKVKKVLAGWDVEPAKPIGPPAGEEQDAADLQNATKGDSSVVEHVNMGVVLCALFGMLAPLAL